MPLSTTSLFAEPVALFRVLNMDKRKCLQKNASKQQGQNNVRLKTEPTFESLKFKTAVIEITLKEYFTFC